MRRITMAAARDPKFTEILYYNNILHTYDPFVLDN